MRLTCPACRAEMDLDVLLSHEEGRKVLADLLTLGMPIGAQLLRYIGLFRPGKRALAMGRTLNLLAEIFPDLHRGTIHRRGRDWTITTQMWHDAIEQLLIKREKGTLTLPLTTHGYLYEVLCAMADKAEGQQERDREEARRLQRLDEPGIRSGSATPVAAALGPPPTIQPKPSGPSTYAKRIQAEIAAAKARRESPTPSEDKQD